MKKLLIIFFVLNLSILAFAQSFTKDKHEKKVIKKAKIDWEAKFHDMETQKNYHEKRYINANNGQLRVRKEYNSLRSQFNNLKSENAALKLENQDLRKRLLKYEPTKKVKKKKKYKG